MKLDIATPALRLLKSGVQPYQPICEGVELQAEDGSSQRSKANLDKLIEAGKVAKSLVNGAGGGVLVAFTDGTQYVAMGFATGHWVHKGDDRYSKVHALARFAKKAFGRQDVAGWVAHFAEICTPGEIPLDAGEDYGISDQMAAMNAQIESVRIFRE